MPHVNRDEIDGVPVLRQEAPGPLTATLLFGVGRRDETFVRGGLTHLVEHLVMGSLGRTHLDCNASVDQTFTEFTATGRPEAVAEFLTRVCAALRDLPLDRLAIEAGVLAAEGGAAAHPMEAFALCRRYGATGVGLAWLRDAAVDQLPPEAVREWAARYFVRGNAALWLTGPIPDGVDLRLPEGERRAPMPPLARRIPLPLPMLAEHPFEEGVAISCELPRAALRAELAAVADGVGPVDDDQLDVLVAAFLRLLETRVTDELRHARGHSYEVDGDLSRPGSDVAHLALWADPRPRDAEKAARGMLDVLRSLAEKGPDQAELDFDLEGMREYFGDPRSIPATLDDAARSIVYATTVVGPAELLARRERVTTAMIAAVARVGLRTLLVAVPEGVGLPRAGLNDEPEDWQPPVTGREYARRFRSDAPRGAKLVVGDEGMTLRLPDGSLTVRWADVIGLGRDPKGFRRLIGFDGRSIPIDAADWKDGDHVVATLLARVPRELWFDEPDDEVPGES